MIPTKFNDYIIPTPDTPLRLFAGVSKEQIVFLQFPDQETQEATFADAGITPSEGESLLPDFHWPGIGDISIIGTIYNNDAVVGEDGEIVTPATSKPGWHVNILPVAS